MNLIISGALDLVSNEKFAPWRRALRSSHALV